MQVLLFLLVFPLLLIITLAIVEFCAMVLVRDTVVSAANEAAREASKVYDPLQVQRTENIVEEVVNEVLSVHGLSIGDGVRVIVEVPDSDDMGMENDILIDLGDPSLMPTPAVVMLVEDELRVVVLLSCDIAPVPNVLATFGLDITGGVYESSSVAIYQVQVQI